MRLILIVMDGLGIGETPDAGEYGDIGSNTLAHISEVVDLNIPVLESLGIGNLGEFRGIKKIEDHPSIIAKLEEVSKGKDTITGHWEMMGIVLEKPFPTYPRGFPPDIVREFEKLTGRKIIGNKPASGTEIIKELGDEHMRTGALIVYTSADSVFQIAAHEEVVAPDELYEICRIARELLRGEHEVARVIARPFKGRPGNFIRTAGRKDFTIEPPEGTLLDIMKNKGLKIISIGKVWDIFSGRGFTDKYSMGSNKDGMEKLIEIYKQVSHGLLFITLTDFDTLYGHRNDPEGFAEALREFDHYLEKLISVLSPKDYLILTADHGCDPLTPSTDHSREYVPAIVYNKSIKGKTLGLLKGFFHIGATIADLFGIEWTKGKSLLK
ncbi:MAG: phosphopentomutase [Thermodesulfovibrionales bacterium]|nr:phosphopentomutase [Thermodesulfovibrionales bacterium]